MVPAQMYRSLGIAIPILTTGILFFHKEAVNILSTGLTLGILFGILNLFMAWSIWKHRI